MTAIPTTKQSATSKSFIKRGRAERGVTVTQHPPIMERIAVVLVRPGGDANVGQTARAMKNFGLRRLLLVNPQYTETELCKQYATSAYDIVERAERFDDLEQALAGFHYVIGTTRRIGKFRERFCTSRALADWLLPQLAGDRRAAIVFGNETSGLSKPELDLCNQLVEIATDPGHRSLNLAQAVVILAYELFSRAADVSPQIDKHHPASHDQLQRLYEHMRRIYLEVGFIDRHNPERNMRVLRRLYSRAAPSLREARILHGILADTEWYINHVCKTGERDGYREMAGDGES
ncbi:MAG: RNA methyltransferase [Myxococcales bacterium]|nr:RNA methyltransferase [Myxococcales bacterium]